MNETYVLSHFQTAPLLSARRAGEREAASSLDLGRSFARLALLDEGVALPDGTTLAWDVVEAIDNAPQVCFAVRAGEATPIRAFSEVTGRLASLMPTPRAPTLVLAGIPMHRIKDVDPLEDTQNKMRAIGALRGRVLDTSTGLGYTAIAAARTAEEVVTIEIDPAVLEVARQNPWSDELRSRENIHQVVGDSFEEVEAFGEGTFDAILHDPPAMRLTGDLYSGEMYRRLYRALRRGGRLYHYVGDPESKSGHAVTRGVVQRLGEAGFRDVRPRPQAFGVVARK